MTPRRPLAVHAALAQGSRLRSIASPDQRAAAWEMAFLVGCGAAAAAASVYLDFRLRIPGHAILRAVFPMVLGMALVPRRNAGTVMGASALVTGLGIRVLSPMAGLSLGALTSLTLTGPLLDLCVRRASSGWRLYLRFAMAGLAANLIALFVRGGAKLLGFEHLGARPLSSWLLHASITYVICGILAGLISGVILFQATRPKIKDEPGAVVSQP
jgi:hypothetical protein